MINVIIKKSTNPNKKYDAFIKKSLLVLKATMILQLLKTMNRNKDI